MAKDVRAGAPLLLAQGQIVLLLLLVVVAASHTGAQKLTYRIDESWPQNKSLISGQPFSVGVDQHQGVVYIMQRGGDCPMLMVSAATGKLVGDWGGVQPSPNKILDTPHGLRLQLGSDGSVEFVWITDVGNMTGHVLRKFTRTGNLQDIIGWPGSSGSSLNPLMFGNVAQLAFAPQDHGGGAYSFFVVDGDGGPNNRLLSMRGFENTFTVTWTTGSKGNATGQLDIPHDVDVTADGERVIVADRANARLQAFSAADGTVLEALTCMRPSQPYGVRVLPQTTADELYLAVTELQDHAVSIVRLSASSAAHCETVSRLTFGDAASPHLLDVHRETGDIFVADVTAAKVYKLVPHS